jgi:hypothetical protein
VSKRLGIQALVAVTMTVVASMALAVEEPPGDISVTRDLTAVIALQGLPCGKVLSTRQLGADDYVAACEDGNSYRVFVNAEGRVVVEKVD